MTHDADRLQTLFDAVLDLPPEQRDAMLERECAGDTALLAELRELLAADALYRDTTAQFVADVFGTLITGGAVKAPLFGLRVGPWQLHEELGNGGMGTVYRAERVDGSVSQTVAIKFVRRELLDASTLKRFQLERQVMAALDHPHIARLLDAAQLPDGTPYYVMEYVDGLPITQYCDRERLDVRQRVELVRKVCSAVAEAHRGLIVHRDLKPGNILIAAGGVPKLLDFGIAKLLQAAPALPGADETATAQRYFSASYAAPEQISGKAVGVACDVYALGLLLYELLVGARPFDFNGMTAGQIERHILSVPPPQPSSAALRTPGNGVARARQLKGDLDGIIQRCLRKDPHERYASVEQLDADLRRYLEGRPVQARGGHAWYRVQKFVLRNKVSVATGTAAILALVLGLIGFAWQAHIAQARAAELEQVSRFQAHMLEQIDPANAGRLLTTDVTERLAAALTKAGVDEKERVARLAAFEAEWQMLNATDAALALIDGTILKPAVSAIDTTFKDQPLLDARLTEVLAARYMNLGLWEAGQHLQERAVALHERTLGAEHPLTLASKDALGEILRMRGKLDESERVLRPTLEQRQRVLGPDHLDTLESMDSLGRLLQQQGKQSEAEPLQRELLARRRRLQGPDDRATLTALHALTMTLYDQGKATEVEPMARELFEARRRVIGVDAPETLNSLSLLTANLLEQQRAVEAEPLLRDELERRLRVQGEMHPETIKTYNRMAILLGQLGRHAEAEPYYIEALDKARRVYGPAHPATLAFEMNLGTVYTNSGKFDAAEPLLVSAVEKRRAHFGERGADTMRATIRLGELRVKQGRHADAVALLAPIEDASRKAFSGAKLFNLSKLLIALGEAQTGLKDYAAAERNLRDAERTIESDPIEDPRMRAGCAEALRALYSAWPEADRPRGHDAKEIP
ncbi:tetratricopeptide repeat protein [Tahibacter amnicola]|uniref:Tetratricopeptide repeat protein n=1 Tax=Tahibacter amnicola TaxID=2976241 RepID=A0ABY6BAJ3_9GAMM|nr:tetratricopeptide repeat protein [Tahibacter amnicola]UXI66170.1 tetratricopeptide repeat protein [Tahibacter amnicola]